jgi:hypothetical protein
MFGAWFEADLGSVFWISPGKSPYPLRESCRKSPSFGERYLPSADSLELGTPGGIMRKPRVRAEETSFLHLRDGADFRVTALAQTYDDGSVWPAAAKSKKTGFKFPVKP